MTRRARLTEAGLLILAAVLFSAAVFLMVVG